MEKRVKELIIKNIDIDKTIVKKFLGYTNRDMAKPIESIFLDECTKAPGFFAPKAYYTEINIDNLKDQDLITPSIANYLHKAKKTYVILYTIGENLDSAANTYGENMDMIRAMILDKIGVVALDNIKSQIKEIILQENPTLQAIGSVYPGNKDFPAKLQTKLYNLISCEKIKDDIEINSYGQMKPIKSVLFLYFLA